MKKQKTKIFLLVVFLGVLVFFAFQNPKEIKAGPEHNVSGWAWSDNIGWISFNCTDQSCVPFNYGVNIDESTGNLTGYAWSDNIGWIYFDPAGPYPDIPGYSAKLDLTSDQFSGWARALSYGDGWDGWFKMDGVSRDGCNITDWAWGSEVLGWIQFYNTTTTFCGNYSPTADAGLDRTIDETQTTTLDGSGSTDSDGSIVSYSWSCDGGILDDSTLIQPTYTPPAVAIDTIYTCTLTVTDDDGDESLPDSVDINVLALDDFTISADILSVRVPQIGSSEPLVTVTVNSLFGFSAAVDLSVVRCSGLGDAICSQPAILEIVGSFALDPITPPADGSANTTLSFNTNGALPGTYYFRARGISAFPSKTHDTDVITLEVIVLGVTLTADPDYGVGVLNNVDLTAQVSGTAQGDVSFKFDCTDDGSWEADFSPLDLSVSDADWVWRTDKNSNSFETKITFPDTFAVKDICDYSSVGVYTAKVSSYREIANPAEGTDIVKVSDFELSANPTNVEAPQISGTSDPQTTITVDSLFGFSSQVDLSVVRCLNAVETTCSQSAVPEVSPYLTNASLTPPADSFAQTTLYFDTNNASVNDYYYRVKGVSGSVSHYTEAINLEVVDISVELKAAVDSSTWQDPLWGLPPLNNVDLKAQVTSPAAGTINYKFWCNCAYEGTDITEAVNQCGNPNHEENNSGENPFIKDNLCNYAAGAYEAKVFVQKGVANPAEDRVYILASNPPAVVGQVIEYQTYCGAGYGTGQIGFGWTYTDPDGDFETMFDFRVNNVNDVNDPNPEVDRGVTLTTPLPSPSDNDQYVLVKLSPGADEIAYGTTYYWWVRVWDDKGLDSGWQSGPSFNTTNHAWPYPQFTRSPQIPAVDEITYFTDTSICFDAFNNSIPCAVLPLTAYLWDFGDGNTSSDKGDTTHIYTSTGNYTIELEITDDVGACTGTLPVRISYPLPEWREIRPF